MPLKSKLTHMREENLHVGWSMLITRAQLAINKKTPAGFSSSPFELFFNRPAEYGLVSEEVDNTMTESEFQNKFGHSILEEPTDDPGDAFVLEEDFNGDGGVNALAAYQEWALAAKNTVRNFLVFMYAVVPIVKLFLYCGSHSYRYHLYEWLLMECF